MRTDVPSYRGLKEYALITSYIRYNTATYSSERSTWGQKSQLEGISSFNLLSINKLITDAGNGKKNKTSFLSTLLKGFCADIPLFLPSQNLTCFFTLLLTCPFVASFHILPHFPSVFPHVCTSARPHVFSCVKEQLLLFKFQQVLYVVLTGSNFCAQWVVSSHFRAASHRHEAVHGLLPHAISLYLLSTKPWLLGLINVKKTWL